MVKDKNSAISRGRNVVKMIEAKKERFVEKQNLKLEKIMKLLQEQMELSI